MSADSRCGIDLDDTVDSDDAIDPDGHDDIRSASDESIGTEIVTAVADAKGVDPLDLEPLFDVVDADAIDAIFSRADTAPTLELRFTMADCEVVVAGSGEVSVTPPTRQGPSDAVPSSGD